MNADTTTIVAELSAARAALECASRSIERLLADGRSPESDATRDHRQPLRLELRMGYPEP